MHLPNSMKVEVRKLEQSLSLERLTTSYKLFWFQGILDEIVIGNTVISFERIVHRMIANAWYPVIHYNLNLGAVDQLNLLIKYISNNYGYDYKTKDSEILEFLKKQNDTEIHRAIENFCKYVPYRFLSPFFENELRGKKDGVKNKLIEELTMSENEAIYSIYKTKKLIVVNEKWEAYINHNQSILSGWINYKLIYYLQKRNPNVPAIPFKLNLVEKRDLAKAQKYWNEVIIRSDLSEIYTQKKFDEQSYNAHGNLSIDHFIPWSFVLHDQLWNLVPTFVSINSSKSNRLPNLEIYLDRFLHIQYSGLKVALEHKIQTKLLEDYLTIHPEMNIKELIKTGKSADEKAFKKAMKQTIEPLYQIAYNQGYENMKNIEI